MSYFRPFAVISLVSVAACAASPESESTEHATAPITTSEVFRMRVDQNTCRTVTQFVQDHHVAILYRDVDVYDRYVSNRLYCDWSHQDVEWASFKTLDDPECWAAYRCVDINNNNDRN